MTCATVMFHLGTALGVLVAARVFQGIAAAIIYSAGLALLHDSNSVDTLGHAMGFVSLAITAGTFLGPSLGGSLFEIGGETAVFSLAYAVLAVDFTLRFLVIERSETSGDTFTYVAMNASSSAPNAMYEPAADGGLSQKREISPTMRLLTTPRFLVALFGWSVVGILLTAFDSILPIHVQSTFGWSTAGAGIMFLLIFAPNLAGPLYGRLVDSSKNAGRLVAALGFTLCFPFLVLLRLTDHKTLPAQVLFCGFLFMSGLGLALCGPPLSVEIARIVSQIEKEEPGILGSNGATARAYGLYNCAFAAGQFVGPLWAGVMSSHFGWATTTCVLGSASGLTGILMGLFLGGWIGSAALEPGEFGIELRIRNEGN